MMSTGTESRSSDAHAPTSAGYGLYEASVSSSAPSSQASVFSDLSSASSSIATSISDDFRSSQEDVQEQESDCAQAQLQSDIQHIIPAAAAHAGLFRPGQQCPSYADVTSVPAPQRINNPRRSSLSRAHRPPPLVRQRDRKVNFVDNLVDSATQMVEVIWPLSVVPCRAEGGGRGVLPLRTYIEETLKRSRTSYSTLQVALYYLVLIRPFVPASDFTMEQTVDCPAERALMCGRRMFLAALILASKYLQDRNYSAKAWSKMSGLKVSEINANERNFLSKINWKLHIPKFAFEKWQEIVLRYSPNPPSSPGWSVPSGISMWKRMIPLLTADLDDLPITESRQGPESEGFSYFDLTSPATPTPASIRRTLTLRPIDPSSLQTTPTPTTVLPSYLEPSLNILPPMPALARMGPLPTPSMTPQTTVSNTPAVSVCGSRQSSMSSAMAIAQHKTHNRCLLDTTGFEPRIKYARRPSFASASSYDSSSPESMMSDHSRSSRASSMSSVSTVATSSSLAPRACLARQATCRNAGLLSTRTIKEDAGESVMKPIVIDDDVDMVSSPMMTDFSVSEKVLHAPHRHSRGPKHASQPTPAPSTEKGKKRGRSYGHRRSELQEEVRHLLEESLDDDEMDLDDRESPAPAYTSSSLSRGPIIVSYRDVQPPATLSGWGYGRLPVQQNDGRKRRCAMSTSPATLYGEVV